MKWPVTHFDSFEALNLFTKQIIPKPGKDTASTHLKVARGTREACTQNHSKSLGYFLIALSCPASDILNASSGLFSIFKLPQQRGIVFLINIAFCLFTHGQIIPQPAAGAADTHIALGAPQGRAGAPVGARRRLSSRGRCKPLIRAECYSSFRHSSACR